MSTVSMLEECSDPAPSERPCRRLFPQGYHSVDVWA